MLISKKSTLEILSIFVILSVLRKVWSSTEKVSSTTRQPNVTIYFPEDIADVDYNNSTFSIISNSYPVFDLICTAPYPIEWLFHYEKDDDGTSEQQKVASTKRVVSNFSDQSTYNYVANISLRYNGKIFVFTNFSCKSVQNADLQTNVILLPQERKNIILINITSEPDQFRDEGQSVISMPNEKETCKVKASVSDMEELSSCWKCEKADGTDLELDFIGCNNPIECSSIYQRHNVGKRCFTALPSSVNTSSRFCRHIGAHDYNPKTLVCKNYGPVLTKLYFFGVPKVPDKAPKIYFDWLDANQQEIIYIHDLPKTLYYGQNFTVTCEMSRYYFSYGSWFGLQFGHTVSFYQTENTIQDESRGSFISKLRVNLTNPGPSKLYCFAPVWNSSEWINTSVSLNIHTGKSPKVIKMSADNAEKQFIIGHKNRSLICDFVGEPKPEVTWEGPKTGFLDDLENNTSILTFPEVTYASAGEYTCIVKSFLGVDSKSFTVVISEESPKLIKTVISVSVSVAIIVAITAAYIVFRLYRVIKYQRETLRLLTEAEIKEFEDGNPEFLSSKNVYFDRNEVIEALPYDKRYEIPPQNLVFDKGNLLGSGKFGKVYKGKIKRRSVLASNTTNSPKTSESSDNIQPAEEELASNNSQLKDAVVAVKTCGTDVDVMYFKALLSEVKIMAFIGHHKNVVSLVGACTQKIRNREVYIAIEFCPMGNLESFLKRHKASFQNKVRYGIIVADPVGTNAPMGSVIYDNIQITDVSDIKLSTVDLMRWTYDVASGLEFIHDKKVIHGDLATRNILLSEDLVAKISDFGLSRQLVECSNYVKKTQCPLPWRHLAPECLQYLEFSLKSDIWSLAVTLWEIFTLSEIPYSGRLYSTDFIQELQRGLRLTKPIFATNDLYEFMLKCWTYKPEDRIVGLEELKIMCAKSLMLFVEHGTAEDSEYLQLCDEQERYEDAQGYLVPIALEQEP